MLNWVQTNTQSLTEAARQLVLWAIGLGLIRTDFAGRPWDETKTMLTVSALSGLLAVIASKTNVPAPKVEERVKEAKEKGREQGQAVEVARAQGLAEGTGSGR
jgi:hypothetical protein